MIRAYSPKEIAALNVHAEREICNFDPGTQYFVFQILNIMIMLNITFQDKCYMFKAEIIVFINI